MRNRGLASGFGPLSFTAMAISLPILVNALEALALLAAILCLRFSNARPIISGL